MGITGFRLLMVVQGCFGLYFQDLNGSGTWQEVTLARTAHAILIDRVSGAIHDET